MFKTLVSRDGKTIQIEGASSILNPKDNTCIFIGSKMADKTDNLLSIKDCLVYVLDGIDINASIKEKNIVVFCENPRKEFGAFLEANDAESFGDMIFKSENGSIISNDAKIDSTVKIEPFVYIEPNVSIGKNTVIKSGVRILANTTIGDNCVIHNNAVIGTIGLAYEDAQRIPQLGGVIIGNNCQIGATAVIARGAIENTVIGNNVAIDSACFISHNVVIGNDVKIVGGTTLFGSVCVGDKSFISGESVVRNGMSIGKNVLIGMGSVVTKSIPDDVIAFGSPAVVHSKS